MDISGPPTKKSRISHFLSNPVDERNFMSKSLSAASAAEDKLSALVEELGSTFLEAEEIVGRYHAVFACVQPPVPDVVDVDREVYRACLDLDSDFFGYLQHTWVDRMVLCVWNLLDCDPRSASLPSLFKQVEGMKPTPAQMAAIRTARAELHAIREQFSNLKEWRNKYVAHRDVNSLSDPNLQIDLAQPSECLNRLRTVARNFGDAVLSEPLVRTLAAYPLAHSTEQAGGPLFRALQEVLKIRGQHSDDS